MAASRAGLDVAGAVGVRAGALLLGGMLVLPAPRPVVYRAFTDPAVLAKWWRPGGCTISSVEMSAELGARYRMQTESPQGAGSTRGEWLVIDPPRRLAFTVASEPPDRDDVETVVRATFNDLGGVTALRWGHGLFRTEACRAAHREAWTTSLDGLERLLMAGCRSADDQ
jgi:uncharacterized protein YndB with AHSA1/START domain